MQEDTVEMDRFQEALRGVMKVSKEDMKRLQANEEAMGLVREKRGPRVKSPLSHKH